MSRLKKQTDRPIRIGLVPGEAKPALKLKDLMVKVSGLVNDKQISKICNFIINPNNSEQERLNAIRTLQGVTLIPTTYDILQSTLQKIYRHDPNVLIKAAAEETFNTQRDKQRLFAFKKVI